MADPTDPTDFATVIGEYMAYHGDLTGAGNYLVHGRVDGNCDLDGLLHVGPTAQWHGDVAATHVVIAGEVAGDVYASARLDLQPTAHVHGSITSPVIAMAEGARYDGEIRVRRHAATPDPSLAAAKE